MSMIVNHYIVKGAVIRIFFSNVHAVPINLIVKNTLLNVKGRALLTYHDAFGYFGRRFDIEVRAIQGISTESEAGLADLEELVSFIVEREIPAVFVESTVSPRTIQALIAGAKARSHEVRIGGQLFSDSMGRAGTQEGTWPGMIAHNVSTIVTALGGTVPREGLIPREFRHAID